MAVLLAHVRTRSWRDDWMRCATSTPAWCRGWWSRWCTCGPLLNDEVWILLNLKAVWSLWYPLSWDFGVAKSIKALCNVNSCLVSWVMEQIVHFWAEPAPPGLVCHFSNVRSHEISGWRSRSRRCATTIPACWLCFLLTLTQEVVKSVWSGRAPRWCWW